MIVLSVGMPRAGSGWHYNLIHDLMKTQGYADAREIREKYRLGRVLTEVNCNIGVLSARRVGMVSIPSILGKSFVIKAHAGPTRWSRQMSKLGMMKATYIYRDPRDAMLSAYEYGRRAEEKGRPNAFSHLVDFETSLDFMMDYVRIWERWIKEPHVLTSRYEDLLTNYDEEGEKLTEFLGLDPNEKAVREALEQYRPGKTEADQQGLHFYKGKIGRYKEAYTAEEQDIMAERFGEYLGKMGYKDS